MCSTSSENIEDMAVVSGWGKTRESKFGTYTIENLISRYKFLNFAILHCMKTFSCHNRSNRHPVGSTDQACSYHNFFRIA